MFNVERYVRECVIRMSVAINSLCTVHMHENNVFDLVDLCVCYMCVCMAFDALLKCTFKILADFNDVFGKCIGTMSCEMEKANNLWL